MGKYFEGWGGVDRVPFEKALSEKVGEAVEVTRYSSRYYVQTKDNKQGVAVFEMVQLPGCCAFAVSCHTEIYEKFRGKGIAPILQELKAEIARKSGYTGMFATITDDNEAQKKILPKSGWVLLADASGKKNPKTGHVIHTYFKSL